MGCFLWVISTEEVVGAVAVHEAPEGKVCQGWVAGQDAAMGTPDTPSQVAGV